MEWLTQSNILNIPSSGTSGYTFHSFSEKEDAPYNYQVIGDFQNTGGFHDTLTITKTTDGNLTNSLVKVAITGGGTVSGYCNYLLIKSGGTISVYLPWEEGDFEYHYEFIRDYFSNVVDYDYFSNNNLITKYNWGIQIRGFREYMINFGVRFWFVRGGETINFYIYKNYISNKKYNIQSGISYNAYFKSTDDLTFSSETEIKEFIHEYGIKNFDTEISVIDGKIPSSLKIVSGNTYKINSERINFENFSASSVGDFFYTSSTDAGFNGKTFSCPERCTAIPNSYYSNDGVGQAIFEDLVAPQSVSNCKNFWPQDMGTKFRMNVKFPNYLNSYPNKDIIEGGYSCVPYFDESLSYKSCYGYFTCSVIGCKNEIAKLSILLDKSITKVKSCELGCFFLTTIIINGSLDEIDDDAFCVRMFRTEVHKSFYSQMTSQEIIDNTYLLPAYAEGGVVFCDDEKTREKVVKILNSRKGIPWPVYFLESFNKGSLRTSWIGMPLSEASRDVYLER